MGLLNGLVGVSKSSGMDSIFLQMMRNNQMNQMAYGQSMLQNAFDNKAGMGILGQSIMNHQPNTIPMPGLRKAFKDTKTIEVLIAMDKWDFDRDCPKQTMINWLDSRINEILIKL